jgi:RimJ/RimL family protein N-acetyltransferase
MSLRAAGGISLTGWVEPVLYRPPERLGAGPVLLRRCRTEDSAAAAAAVKESLEHLQPWLPWATPEAAGQEMQRARIAEAEVMWDAGTDFLYSVFLPGSPAVAGGFGLHRRIGPEGIEMGYWMHAAHCGRGYATAAARALTGAGLALPDVRRVEIHCDEANAASAAVPRKLGYRLVRVDRREPEAPGEAGRLMIWVQERR